MDPSSESAITIHLLSPDEELCTWFFNDIGADTGSPFPSVSVSNRNVVFRKATTIPEIKKNGSADILVALVRFVDVLSLKALEDLIHAVPGSERVPTGVLIYRNEGETDFKMSCPYCGQKLWVRDADEDKRGRCPHCKKGFTLPEQGSHVRSALRLQKPVPISHIIRNDTASLSGPIKKILQLTEGTVLESLKVDSDVLSNQTMNVDIDLSEEG